MKLRLRSNRLVVFGVFKREIFTLVNFGSTLLSLTQPCTATTHRRLHFALSGVSFPKASTGFSSSIAKHPKANTGFNPSATAFPKGHNGTKPAARVAIRYEIQMGGRLGLFVQRMSPSDIRSRLCVRRKLDLSKRMSTLIKLMTLHG
jgi:hypothetical protein